MNGEIWVLFPDRSNQKSGRFWLQYTSHVFDAENMDFEIYQLSNQIHVVLQIILLFRIKHVTTIAYGSLDNTASLMHCFNADFKLVDIVQRIEDTENINT